MAHVRLGRVGRAHGVHGEVALDGVSLTPHELHAVRTFLWRGRGGAERTLTLETARPTHDRVLARFAGIGDRPAAQALTLGELWVEESALPDPGPGVAYTFQLIGLSVRTEDGRELGTLADIVTTGANPVYVVSGERERLLPAPPEFVKRVDLAARTITLALPPGFEEL